MVLRECTDSTELLPLEHSTSAVWKFLAFQVKMGGLLKQTKRKESGFIVNSVDVIIRTLATRAICGNT